MNFMKKSDKYVLQHTKSQAKEALLEDERVEKIDVKPYHMTIHTQPIMPKTFFGKGLILAPIGKYRIYLEHYKTSKVISIKILRVEGYIDDDDVYHIHDMGDNHMCWGNVDTEIDIIRKNRDWYWAGIYCLNLIEDFSDGTYSETEGIEFQCQAQLSFMNNDEFEKKLMKKVYRYLKKEKIEIYKINRNPFFKKAYEGGLEDDKNKRRRKKQNI